MPDMHGATRVDRLETLDAFDAERTRWEELEAHDPHATVFTSWRWLRAYLPVARLRWSVLALRDRSTTLAYLPISRGGSFVDRELYLGGNPVADYTGMIALASHGERAALAFADALYAEPWDAFNVADVSDPRLDLLVRRLAEKGLAIESSSETRCLSCALPTTWEAYLATHISAKTRVNMLRVERRLAAAVPNFRISEPSDADIDAHVDAMVVVNHLRWGGNLRNARRRYGALFRNAYERGVLRMFLYWNGDEPIAGATAFPDALRSSFGLYMIGFDERYARLSPGKGIVGRAIRAAIEGGFRHFDFLRGDEPFKARYASAVHVTKHDRIVRPGARTALIAFARPKWFALKLAAANVVYGGERTIEISGRSGLPANVSDHAHEVDPPRVGEPAER